jgi:hypothetical protein
MECSPHALLYVVAKICVSDWQLVNWCGFDARLVDAEFLEKAIPRFDECGVTSTPWALYFNARIQRDLAINENHCSVRQQNRLVHVVGHEQHRGMVTHTQTLQEGVHLYSRESVERAKGFVKQHQLRLAYERSRECYSLCLTTRKGEWPVVGVLGEADFIKGVESSPLESTATSSVM